jgi:DNA-binding beta-propeller fold protein YncE
MYVSKKVINNEFYYIEQFLNVTDCYGDVIDISWDGNDLYVSDEKGKYDFVGSRSDLAEFIPELKYISLSQLREKI